MSGINDCCLITPTPASLWKEKICGVIIGLRESFVIPLTLIFRPAINAMITLGLLRPESERHSFVGTPDSSQKSIWRRAQV